MKIKKPFMSGIIILVSFLTIIGLSGLNFITPKNPDSLTQEQSDKEKNQDNQVNQKPAPLMGKFKLETEDGVKIAANFYPAVGSADFSGVRGWILFLHMMPANKESWDSLVKQFQSLGYEAIAIDFRGHGESDQGPNGYKNFSDAEQQKKILDVRTAVDYLLQNRGADPAKISLVGASIGANLALEYLSEHPEVKTSVFLSAGLDYHGVKAEAFVKNLKTDQRVFFVSSRDDDGNVPENQKLFDLAPAGIKKEIKNYDTAGHGTDMMEKQPELEQLIINFIKNG